MWPLITTHSWQVVEPKRLTLAQLSEYNGSEEAKPIYLSICGTIFDVSKGIILTGMNDCIVMLNMALTGIACMRSDAWHDMAKVLSWTAMLDLP